MIRFIAAIDKHRGMADNHGIPWAGKIPSDVKYFREKTTGGVVLMGYATYLEFDQPLPNRRNLVATGKNRKLRDGFEPINDAAAFLGDYKNDIWVSHLDTGQGAGEQRMETYMQYGEGVAEQATQTSAKSVGGVGSSAGKQADTLRGPVIWVIGGAGLLASTINLADELYLTLLDRDFNCTKFFPEYEKDFELVSQTEPQTENGVTFRFTVWKRK